MAARRREKTRTGRLPEKGRKADRTSQPHTIDLSCAITNLLVEDAEDSARMRHKHTAVGGSLQALHRLNCESKELQPFGRSQKMNFQRPYQRESSQAHHKKGAHAAMLGLQT